MIRQRLIHIEEIGLPANARQPARGGSAACVALGHDRDAARLSARALSRMVVRKKILNYRAYPGFIEREK